MRIVIVLLSLLLLTSCQSSASKSSDEFHEDVFGESVSETVPTEIPFAGMDENITAEAQSLEVLFDELSLKADLKGTEAVIEDYGELERRITSGEVDYDANTLYYFYLSYFHLLRARGAAYAEPMSNFVKNTEMLFFDKADLTPDEQAELDYMQTHYRDMLCLTTEYDDILIKGMENLSRYYKSHKDQSDIERLYELSGCFVDDDILILTGRATQAFKTTKGYLEEHTELLNDVTVFGIQAVEELLNKDAAAAAESADALYSTLYDFYAPYESPSMFSYLVEEDLKWIYVLKARGIIPEEIVEQYLEALSVKTNIIIADVTGKAVASGFLSGDIIVSVNGMKPICREELTYIVTNVGSDFCEVTVLRDDSEVMIQADKSGNTIGTALTFEAIGG